MITKNIKAILFDMDGTLLDTREYIYQSFEHTLQKHNFGHVTRADFHVLQGRPLKECYQLLAPGHEYEPLHTMHRAFQRENMHLVQPFPNTLSTLLTLKQRGIKMAVVSTRAQTVLDSLRQARLLDLLEAVITGDDIENFKPHPEGVLKALARLNVPVEHAMMVGDTEADVMAGRNANTVSVGATYGFTPRNILQLLNPDYLIDDIQEVLELV